MRVLLLGVNHRTAPVELREKLALATSDPAAALRAMRERFPLCEAALVSTCNRLEVYAARPTHHAPTADDLRNFLAERAAVPAEAVSAASIHREGEQAVAHLFRVSAGLDSMVLGEPQILGQVKRAYESAAACGAAGPTLHKVFQAAAAAAKRVRTATGIGSGRMSVATVAVDFARQIFDDFRDKTVVGIGAGDMAKATLRHLLRLEPGKLWVLNRSPERAAALAAELGLVLPRGGARAWDELDALLVEADIVLTSTASREPILTAERFKPLLRKRRGRPLFIVDIALPRDVGADVGTLSNVYLYNLDDLQKVVQANAQTRGGEVERCEAQLADAAAACHRQLQHRDLGVLIRQLRTQLHDIGDAESDRTARKLAALGVGDEAVQALLQEHTQRVVNKILHLPLSQLDGKDAEAPLGFYAAALRRLFALDEADTLPHGEVPKPADAPPVTAPAER